MVPKSMLFIKIVSKDIPPSQLARIGHAQSPATGTGTGPWSFSPLAGCTQEQLQAYEGGALLSSGLRPQDSWGGVSQATGQEFSGDSGTPQTPCPAEEPQAWPEPCCGGQKDPRA